MELNFTPSISCLDLGINIEPHRRQLHITMAHQYLPEHHAKLEELATSLVDPAQSAKWELRLYSRDIRLSTSEVSQFMEMDGWMNGRMDDGRMDRWMNGRMDRWMNGRMDRWMMEGWIDG